MRDPDPGLPFGAHVFVDETKAGDYVMVATWVPSAQVAHTRRRLRALLRPRQARLHFQKMNRADRHRAIELIAGLEVSAVVYRSPLRDARSARCALLETILGDAGDSRARRVVIERDDASLGLDLAVARATAMPDDPVVTHLRSVDEPLLWVSDAAAWCVHRGGEWRTKVAPVLRERPSGDKAERKKKSEPG
ncbi:hypothetical protein [Pimelobacter simplex]|uniref:hypothetical protein n=1 Tax=Nocardioides simplex TaxID=2045 RepID=UPI0021500963|nr:hypothetical protein [Pimelobacter simplex]UUW92331.1 hypothetical protein M0M43_12860 [Pimelobacter simplex]UUW96159.1 hypothetical protein M0M48_01495 [Pimelobacter simplex]